MKKRILITYASYGSGHKTVAEYIHDYFKEHGDYEIKIVDVMDYGNLIAKSNQKSYNKGSIFTNGVLFSLTYELFDNKIAATPYKELVKLLFKSNLKKDILEYNPDILISTHFFGGILVGMINKKFKTNTKIITILTDYASHAIWLKNHKKENAIIVSNEIVKKELIDYGVDENKIYPFGIPLSSKFKNIDKNIKKIKTNYKINNNNLTFLFFGGGSNGANYTYKYFKSLVKERLNINIIFVSGKNKKLENKCKEYIKKENIKNVTILGFTKDVCNLLNISDVVITKPGGLSITEALELKTPMVLIPGNGGQENHNASFIVKNQFGLKVKTPRGLTKVIIKLVDNKKIINNMYNNLKKYEENKSVEKLFNLVKKMENKI